MADVLKKVPVREQEAKVRAANFEEVCYGYDKEEAMEEAVRCLNCKNAKCIQGCPVAINIPGFISKVKEGDIEGAYKVIGESSALPAICGRVCPQESQCECKCIRGIKGEPVSIGKLERFVADYALEHDIKPQKAEKMNGHKVAVIGSGMTGLETAELLMEQGNTVTIIEMADKIAPGAYPINASDVIGRLEKGGVRFLPGRKLERIGDGMLSLRRKDGVPEEIRADATVLAIGVRSNNALEKECAGHFERLYSIGDAVKPGRIGNATRSAFMRARRLQKPHLH